MKNLNPINRVILMRKEYNLNELWKDIIGFEGCYQVSNSGRIKNISPYGKTSQWKHKQQFKNRILKGMIHPRRYLRVRLYHNGQYVTKQIHRLVLQAFVGDCPNGMETRHLDGNPANNLLSNLKWDTKSENNKDRFRHGFTHKGDNNPSAKAKHNELS